jgi:hypothetical protein
MKLSLENRFKPIFLKGDYLNSVSKERFQLRQTVQSQNDSLNLFLAAIFVVMMEKMYQLTFS